jgi:hypothetical protein
MEIRQVPRLWLRGHSYRRIAELVRADQTTVHRLHRVAWRSSPATTQGSTVTTTRVPPRVPDRCSAATAWVQRRMMTRGSGSGSSSGASRSAGPSPLRSPSRCVRRARGRIPDPRAIDFVHQFGLDLERALGWFEAHDRPRPDRDGRPVRRSRCAANACCMAGPSSRMREERAASTTPTLSNPELAGVHPAAAKWSGRPVPRVPI